MEDKYTLKAIPAQSTYFKSAPSKSRDTGIFIDSDAVAFLGDTLDTVDFIIHKDDCINAIAAIVLSIPLYTSVNGNLKEIKSASTVFSDLSRSVDNYFGDDSTAEYNDVTISKTTGGRNYLYGLDKDYDFNIREFFISKYTDIIFSKIDEGKFDLRFNTYPIIKNSETESLSEYEECSYTDDDLSPIILYGPPGTGKTYRLQHDYLVHFDKRLAFFTTFHQSFSYEEFVEGLKPTLGDSDVVKYNIEQGVFFQACEKAAELAGYKDLREALKATPEDREEKFSNAIEDNKLVLLCIDEINRGNVASIFGDLISLIESSKRLGNRDELILTLPYSKERFGVPSNLMIVGTMNTADRSIQLLDSALRRRFSFEELPPILEKIKYEPARNVLRAINKRVRAVLNKDAQIGHTYFINVENDRETLDVIVKKVIPLLEEYFYNDIDKIRFVLNDYGDTAKFYFEDTETKEAYEHYTEIADMDSEERNFFYINPAIYGIEGTSETFTASDFLNQIIGE